MLKWPSTNKNAPNKNAMQCLTCSSLKRGGSWSNLSNLTLTHPQKTCKLDRERPWKCMLIHKCSKLPDQDSSSIFGWAAFCHDCRHNSSRRPRLLCSQPFPTGVRATPVTKWPSPTAQTASSWRLDLCLWDDSRLPPQGLYLDKHKAT